MVCDIDWCVAGLVVSAGDERFAATSLIPAGDIQGACWEDRLVHVRKGCQPEPCVAPSQVNPCRTLRDFDYRGQFRDTVMASESQRSGCACSER